MKLVFIFSLMAINYAFSAMTTVDLSRLCREEPTQYSRSECYQTCRPYIMEEGSDTIGLCIQQFHPTSMTQEADALVYTACNNFREQQQKKEFCFRSCSRISRYQNPNLENEVNECVARVERTFAPRPIEAEPPTTETQYQWASDANNRIILSSRSCNSKVCVGEVQYTDQNGITKVLSAVCNANKCGNDDATACARESSFGIQTVNEYNESNTPNERNVRSPRDGRVRRR